MSNGGLMSYSLACEHPDVFSAIGSVTGTMSTADFGCTPQEVVPIIHLHGTEDDIASYYNGVGYPGWGNTGVPDIIGHWTGLMGTTTLNVTQLPNQEAVDTTSVDFFQHSGALGGQEFHHYRVNGGGHNWFGVFGSPDVDATAVLWGFFSAQCNGNIMSINNAHIAETLIERRDSGVILRSAGRIDLFDLQGRLVGTQQMIPNQLWIPPHGIRLLHATTHDGRQEVLLWD
jgi:S-formylglutathione hydrolase FrmB